MHEFINMEMNLENKSQQKYEVEELVKAYILKLDERTQEWKAESLALEAEKVTQGVGSIIKYLRYYRYTLFLL